LSKHNCKTLENSKTKSEQFQILKFSAAYDNHTHVPEVPLRPDTTSQMRTEQLHERRMSRKSGNRFSEKDMRKREITQRRRQNATGAPKGAGLPSPPQP